MTKDTYDHQLAINAAALRERLLISAAAEVTLLNVVLKYPGLLRYAQAPLDMEQIYSHAGLKKLKTGKL